MATIGLVGVGLLGTAVATRLLAAGHRVVGFDTAADRLRGLLDMGGEAAASARAVALAGDAVCTVLPTLPAVEAAILGPDGVAAAGRPGQVVIQMSTISPALTVRLAGESRARGVDFLDCPVSGTSGVVARGGGVLFVGGERGVFERWRPLLEAVAPRAVYIGAAGQAMVLKLVANLLVALHSAAAAEALELARRAGLDPARALEALADSAADSRMLQVRGPLIVRGEYPAQMKLELFMKDLHLIQDAAATAGAALPLTDVAERLYAAAAAAGHGAEDLAVVVTALGAGPRGAERGMGSSRPSELGQRWISFVGNLLGAVVAFLYFRVVDQSSARLPPVGWIDIVVSLVVFALLVAVGVRLSLPWTRPLDRVGELHTLPPAEAELVRRRALLFPYFLAGISFVGWLAAGLIWGVVWPALAGGFSPSASLRLLFGITVIAGGVTVAFIFFASEHQWRRYLPQVFPEGGLGAVAGVPRLTVRVRLLAILLLIGVVPLAVLAMLAYTRALALVGADPAAAAGIVDGLRMTILFLLSVGVAAAIGLSVFAANSVAAPLREVEGAMARVERGLLDGRAPVVSTDEIGAVAEGFNRMLQGLRERELVKETFGKYVTPEIRDEILAGRIRGEGALVEATILFADLRDFTPWVEATEPRRVVRDLNEYFTLMDQAIRAHGGLVLQFIGDEIEAVFGAPIASADHAARAVQAALEMRRRLQDWNARREAAGLPPLRNGIGIHTGTVLAGNIGGAERLSYALVGDPVNLASRIQGLTKDFKADILISDATRSRLDGTVTVEELPAVRVKGRTEDVTVYRVG